MSLISRLDSYEDSLIERFREHPVLQDLDELSDEAMAELLLQQRFLGLQFTPIYDEAIAWLRDGEARCLARTIRNEEYPRGAPSHREDVIADLRRMGIPLPGIVSEGTEEAAYRLLDAVTLRRYEPAREQDIRIVSVLRLSQEVLVAEAFGFIVPEVARRYGLEPEEQRFFEPHRAHDRKALPLGARQGSDADAADARGSHADGYGRVLRRLVRREEHLGAAKLAMREALEARTFFYDQFRPFL